MEWWFESEAPMGGASSGAFRNPLAGVGVPPVDIFVREVIQNSVDAEAASDSTVRVRVENNRLDGERLSKFRETLSLDAGSNVLLRTNLLPDRQVAGYLDGPLEVLTVEDYETVGLGGTVLPIAATDDDNFRRLCHKVGSTREAEGGGGSFGYGKATYWAASSIWTVVFYSRFAPTERSQGDWARLFGVSWFKEHTWTEDPSADEVEFTGRAFFGLSSEHRGQPMVLPIVNDEAQDLAEQLGLRVRKEQETGTTALILGNKLDLDGIVDGIERHWWPRLLADRLEVEVVGERSPEPRADPDLRPFVRAWQILDGGAPRDEETHKKLTYKSRSLGSLALVLDEDPGSKASNTIALVRGPLMVVQNYEHRAGVGPSQPTCSGVFRAAAEMDEPLSASEPPAHNAWDPSTGRTDRPLAPEDRGRIRKIFEKIRGEVNKFTRLHREPPPEAPPRCRLLESALADLFATEETGPPPPPSPGKDPFNIRFVVPPTRLMDGGNAVIDATVDVSVREEGFVDEEQVMCTMTASLQLIHDAGSIGQRLPMSYMNAKDPRSGEEFVGESRGTKTRVLAVFSRDEGPWRVELRTEPLPHPEYRTRLSFEVEKVL